MNEKEFMHLYINFIIFQYWKYWKNKKQTYKIVAHKYFLNMGAM